MDRRKNRANNTYFFAIESWVGPTNITRKEEQGFDCEFKCSTGIRDYRKSVPKPTGPPKVEISTLDGPDSNVVKSHGTLVYSAYAMNRTEVKMKNITCSDLETNTIVRNVNEGAPIDNPVIVEERVVRLA